MPVVFTYNRHPAYIYLLSHADGQFLVNGEWSPDVRPHPANVEFVADHEVEWALEEADIWLSHLIVPDLVRLLRHAQSVEGPRKIVQVMHGRIDRVGHVRSSFKRTIYRRGKRLVVPALRNLSKFRAMQYVFISDYVADSWPLVGEVIYPGAPLDEIRPAGVRDSPPFIAGNNLDRRHFDIGILSAIRDHHELNVLGENDTIDSVYLPWNRLKEIQASALCYVNVLRPPENSFNLATVEALAGGCPIVTTDHPASIFTHEENALVCDSEAEFVEAINRLQNENTLRERLSCASRETAEVHFPMGEFVKEWNTVLST